MAKAYNRYTTLRYIIDAPLVAISYLLSFLITSGKSLGDFTLYTYLFTFIALIVWYIASSFSRLYADRRSNKYSEEIVFIIYTIILFTILLSSVSFFLRNIFQFNSNFFTFFLGILFLLMTLTKYIIRKYLHSAIYQGKLFDISLSSAQQLLPLIFMKRSINIIITGINVLAFSTTTVQK